MTASMVLTSSYPASSLAMVMERKIRLIAATFLLERSPYIEFRAGEVVHEKIP